MHAIATTLGRWVRVVIVAINLLRRSGHLQKNRHDDNARKNKCVVCLPSKCETFFNRSETDDGANLTIILTI